MTIINKMLVFTGMLLFLSGSVQASESELRQLIEGLQQENEQLRRSQQEQEEKLNKLLDDNTVAQEMGMDLEKQLQSRVKLSGYADVEYRQSSLEGSNDGFRLHHFSLFVSKNISERWRLFSEVEYEDGPFIDFGGGSNCSNCSGQLFLEAMNIDYLYTTAMNLKAGRFYTPAGIWLTDYYPPYVATQERPAHIRQIFPQYIDGAMVFGNPAIGNAFLNYNLYVGNGESAAGAGDNNSSKSVGMRAALVFDRWELGGSYYRDTINDGMDGVAKSVVGAHAKAQGAGFTFQTEYAYGTYKRPNGDEYDKDGYYGQLLYNKNQYVIGYRFDRFVDYKILPPRQREKYLIHSAIFNYRVSNELVLKLEHHVVDSSVSANYNSTILSIAVHLGE
ncbi:MAG: hypothetical protein OEZ68_08710 [Gammaproteobacteria bacterium]|nr:hypothetical protein [Gammaproteobacteria bacterium]MDH5800867.1 hypothetical protein [Gammaproteobacteria bacterium]